MREIDREREREREREKSARVESGPRDVLGPVVSAPLRDVSVSPPCESSTRETPLHIAFPPFSHFFLVSNPSPSHLRGEEDAADDETIRRNRSATPTRVTSSRNEPCLLESFHLRRGKSIRVSLARTDTDHSVFF